MTELIGVVHLSALPGSPLNDRSIAACVETAVSDACALHAGGADGIIVENFNDVPFRPGPVEPYTVAAMTIACSAVKSAVACRVGVNVLRNDAAAAIGIAAACGLDFIRVNVHTGAMLTDQGIVSGRADDTLRIRRAVGAGDVRILADVHVKHAVPLVAQSIAEVVRDAVERGLADAVIVSGSATGMPASVEDVCEAANATRVPVYVGSGITAENAGQYVPHCSGVIVGTWIKSGGRIENPVDVERVRALRAALNSSTMAMTAG